MTDDNQTVRLNQLPDLTREVGESILKQPNTAGNLLNVAWTLQILAASQIHLLRRTGAALTEDTFAQMARDAYRAGLTDKGD